MVNSMTLVVPLILAMTQTSASYYPLRLQDPKAVYLDRFPAKGDGVTDDTEAIQQAIDRVREGASQGILFIPEGRYRLTKTLTVWPGVRLIGFGKRRPVFLLGPNTPGYQTNEKLMVFFAGGRPNLPAKQPAIPEDAGLKGGDFGVPDDANPGTFYSALSNVDFEIGEGNPAAVGIRARYAQHSYLAHIDFRLKSGLAAIHDIGNQADDLRFFGGDYGLITRTPSPGWQFTMMDSYFEGQAKAAIRTHVTGLTLIRPSFKNVPTAISVDEGHSEQLWMKDAEMENVSGPALVISRENSLRTQINVEDVACRNVPTFAKFRESERVLGRTGAYHVQSLSHGLTYASLGQPPKVQTRFEVAKPKAEKPRKDVPDLPPMETWVDVTTLGAKGDDMVDDTEAIKKAIALHKTLYFPTGIYRVTDTLVLKKDTVLIGLNPITTQLALPDATPGYNAAGERSVPFAGAPKALLETPKEGTNIVTGIGLDSGGNNPAAVAAKWMAGTESMMDDVKFVGGHGSNMPNYNADRTGDANPSRKWDSQYASLWVTAGGGGTFKNLWTASSFAAAGMLVTDTETEGRVYQMSTEHHVRNEVQIRRAKNWHFIALQAEEERGESPFALPLEIDRCEDITIANLNIYRVVSVTQPFHHAVKVTGSKNIRFRNVHCYSNSKASFDNLLFDASHDFELRQREFATLTLTGERPKRMRAMKVEKLAGGFHNISGGAVHPNGDFYFVDPRWHRIHRWSVARRQVELVHDAPLLPVNLAFDRAGNLIVLAYGGKGTAYTFRPDLPGEPTIASLKAEPTQVRPGKTFYLPDTDWLFNEAIVRGAPLLRRFQIPSPDGSTFLPVGQDFVDGTLTWGVKLQDVLRSFGLVKAEPGKPFYVTGESEMRTYRVDVAEDGAMIHATLFAEQGGESVVQGPDGRVYLAAGQIFVYTPEGRQVETIEVPERPTHLAFGGPDGRTLFITARTGLYAVKR